MAATELTLRLPVIGVVRTSHHELETTPIQAGLKRAEHGTIEIAEPCRDGVTSQAVMVAASTSTRSPSLTAPPPNS